MDQLGCKRYCCRRMIMTHVDLIEKLLRYAIISSVHPAPLLSSTLLINYYDIAITQLRETARKPNCKCKRRVNAWKPFDSWIFAHMAPNLGFPRTLSSCPWLCFCKHMRAV